MGVEGRYWTGGDWRGQVWNGEAVAERMGSERSGRRRRLALAGRLLCDECGRPVHTSRLVCTEHAQAGTVELTPELRWCLEYVRQGIPRDFEPRMYPGATPGGVAIARVYWDRWQRHRGLDELERENARLDPMILWRRTTRGDYNNKQA